MGFRAKIWSPPFIYQQQQYCLDHQTHASSTCYLSAMNKAPGVGQLIASLEEATRIHFPLAFMIPCPLPFRGRILTFLFLLSSSWLSCDYYYYITSCQVLFHFFNFTWKELVNTEKTLYMYLCMDAWCCSPACHYNI